MRNNDALREAREAANQLLTRAKADNRRYESQQLYKIVAALTASKPEPQAQANTEQSERKESLETLIAWSEYESPNSGAIRCRGCHCNLGLKEPHKDGCIVTKAAALLAADKPVVSGGVVADLQRTVEALKREEDGGWSPDAHSLLNRLATSIRMLAADKTLRSQAIPLSEDQRKMLSVTGDVSIPGAADKAGGGVDDATHPRFVAGFKVGRYAGLRRLESLPENAPKPELGSVKCPKCSTQFIAFLIHSQTQPYALPDDVVKDAGLSVMDVLFDGYSVYQRVKQNGKDRRTSPENVSDVLDAVAAMLKDGKNA